MAGGAQGIWNVDWLNENSQRKYPLSDEATLIDESNSFSIPNDLIVDFLWPVHSDSAFDVTKFHIAAIGVFGLGVTVSIGYDGDIIGSASIDSSTFARNTSYPVQGLGDFFDTVGRIVIGSIETVFQSAGSYTFSVAAGRLVPTVIMPSIRQVTALYIKNGNDVSAPIQNDVVLEAGKNMVISIEEGDDDEPARLVFSAIEGTGLNQDCECNENKTLPCIKTINGIPPEEDTGNFTLLGDECIELGEIANGLSLHEKCAKPCCGCEELKVVTDTLDFMVTQVHSLENLAARLEATLQVLQVNLIASKTGNQR